jgi:CHAT domain-containing protein
MYESINAVTVLPGALYEAAKLARVGNDTALERRRLADAILVVDRQRVRFNSPESQATYTETVENLFDSAVEAEWDAGRHENAFKLAERARLIVSQVGDSTSGTHSVSLAEIAAALAPDDAFVEYAVLPTRTLVWSVQNGRVVDTSIAVSRDSLGRLARAVANELRAGEPRGATTTAYDLLIRPTRLDARSVIVVVPDRELTAIPFAALVDSRSGQPLVRRAAVVAAPSSAFILSAAARGWSESAPRSAAAVGSPGDDGGTLPRLAGAEAEAKAVAHLYGVSRPMLGDAASRTTVLRGLEGAEVFHFAGHAVFDPDLPERSYLVLADSAGGAARLRAREIARLRLSNSRVVVLSACRTLSARPTHQGPAQGLTAGFLRAGTSGIVSTLWDIEDDAAAEIVVAFHRALREPGTSPASALRRAQLSVLESAGSRARLSGAWAAFVYAGPWTIRTLQPRSTR